jgi:hypothetical protein
MASQIILQPDGLFAVWSSKVDGFIAYDCSPDEIIGMEVELYRQLTVARINKVCDQLVAGEKPSGRFTLTYKEAHAMHVDQHGELNKDQPKATKKKRKKKK